MKELQDCPTCAKSGFVKRPPVNAETYERLQHKCERLEQSLLHEANLNKVLSRGRTKWVIISFIIAVAIAGIVWAFCWAAVQPATPSKLDMCLKSSGATKCECISLHGYESDERRCWQIEAVKLTERVKNLETAGEK